MGSPSRGRILIVDPDAIELGAHARVLGEAGFEVKAAPNGIDASSLLQKERFDAVLTDVSAPTIDALELVHAIRKLDKDVWVIMMSAAPTTGEPAVVEHGAVECLSKPVAPNALERTMERAVRLSRRWRTLTSYRNAHGEEVEVASFTATAAKNEFGRVLQRATRQGMVVITRHDEPEAVMLSFEEFKDLARTRESKLEALSSEFDLLLAKMQTPEARRGMKAAFDATPARMGEAAVKAARKRG
jgi:prevent-host-death family protein